MIMDPDSSLTDLFKNALADASKASNLPTVEGDTQVIVLFLCFCAIHQSIKQDLLNRIIETLREIAKRVELLSLFSPNETLEDISTGNLPFLFVPYVLAGVENRARTNGRQERMAQIRSIQVRYVIQLILPTIHGVFVCRPSIKPSTMRFTPTRLSQNRSMHSTPNSRQRSWIPQKGGTSRLNSTNKRKNSGAR